MDEIPILDEETLELVRSMAGPSHGTMAVVIREAVRRMHRSWMGVPAGQLGLPFKKRFSDLDAEVLLRQSSDTTFTLDESFRFLQSESSAIVVEEGDVTDLASVPQFLTWLVPRYGRHTLPAVLHDQLVEAGMDPVVREQADTTLRDAMGATKVPFIRRWVMWAAVSLATQFKRRWPWWVVVGLWLLVYAAAGVDLLIAGLGHRPVPAASSLHAILLIAASPLVVSVVWGRRYRFGLIIAYALLVLPAPVIAVGIALGIYLLAEGVAQVLLRLARVRGAHVRINPVRLSRVRRLMTNPEDIPGAGTGAG